LQTPNTIHFLPLFFKKIRRIATEREKYDGVMIRNKKPPRFVDKAIKTKDYFISGRMLFRKPFSFVKNYIAIFPLLSSYYAAPG
jgi:hypothetical protein